MEAISYEKVQEVVMRLPIDKLSTAYHLLADLIRDDKNLSSQNDLLLLPLAKRQRMMEDQAKQLLSHYEDKISERMVWQSGDFLEY